MIFFGTYSPISPKIPNGKDRVEPPSIHSIEDIPMMAELMNNGILKTDKLVTKLIKLEELEKACQVMLAHQIVGRWVIKFD